MSNDDIIEGSRNVKLCESCGVNVRALPGLRHIRTQYARLADYCISHRLFKGPNSYSHTDFIIREIERLTAELAEARSEIDRYKKWFADVGSVLATHNIGGFSFDVPLLLGITTITSGGETVCVWHEPKSVDEGDLT